MHGVFVNKQNIFAIVLAAGKGKRMNSALPKVAHLLLNKPLIIWVIESLLNAGIRNICSVVSLNQKLIKDIVFDYIDNYKKISNTNIKLNFAIQEEQLGTAHAVQCGLVEIIKNFQNSNKLGESDTILIAYGDTPAVRKDTFQSLVETHNRENNDFTILGFDSKNPFGYGRILVDEKNEFVAIREQKDCNSIEETITKCNSGILCAKFQSLQMILPLIKNNNSSNEFYLTDVPFIAKHKNLKIGLVIKEEENEFLGINTQEQLIYMEKLISNRK